MNTAKSIAITSGRSAGIVFIRDELNPSVAYEVAVAESPAPYAGEGMGKKLVSFFPPLEIPAGSGFRRAQIRFDTGQVRPLRSEGDDDPTNWFVRPGDKIRFDMKGEFHTIFSVTDSNAILLETETQFGIGKKFMHFQIFRAPRRTMAAPVELPQGAYVKLSSSGMAYDQYGVELDPLRRLFSHGDVTLTFNPTGKVDRLYRGFPVAGVDDPIMGLSVPVRSGLRIDLGDGSPDQPDNAQRYMVNNRADRSSKAIATTALQ